MTTIKNVRTGETITRNFTENQLTECIRDGFEIIRKGIATIETEIGTMTIYYNGTDAEMTGKTEDGETVESLEYIPENLDDAKDVVSGWYSSDWGLTWIDDNTDGTRNCNVDMDDYNRNCPNCPHNGNCRKARYYSKYWELESEIEYFDELLR